MQPLAGGAAYTAYMARLRGSHDFQIAADILDLNENLVGSARLLDGQVDITSGDLVRRTAALTLSDPAGALDFSNASAYSGTSIWVDRLIRIRHTVSVPGYGNITAVPFVGPPTALSRQGAEVQVQCADKAALANRGARPYTAPKGMNAITAIRNIMSFCTGEFRFRMPTTTRRLSRNYSSGLSEDASPMLVAATIARGELGMQLLYSCDGYLLLRPVPAGAVADLGYVTDQASASIDFSTIANWVQVSGKSTSKTKNNVTVTSTVTTTQQLDAASALSPQRLQRAGVPRYLPLVVSDSALTTTAQTAARASAELTAAAALTDDISASVIPVFHLDADDVVVVHTSATASRTMVLSDGSIPLGIGGEMTIGFHRWVSTPALGRPKSRIVRTVKHNPVKKKAKKRHKAKGHHK